MPIGKEPSFGNQSKPDEKDLLKKQAKELGLPDDTHKRAVTKKVANKKEYAEEERRDALIIEQHAKEMEEYNRQVRDLERDVEAIREDRDNADYDNYDTIQLELIK